MLGGMLRQAFESMVAAQDTSAGLESAVSGEPTIGLQSIRVMAPLLLQDSARKLEATAETDTSDEEEAEEMPDVEEPENDELSDEAGSEVKEPPECGSSDKADCGSDSGDELINRR